MVYDEKVHKCPICGTSIKTENMSEHIRRAHVRDLDSGQGYDAERPLSTGPKMDLDACDKLHDKAARFIERNKFKKAIKTLQKIPKEYRIPLTFIHLWRLLVRDWGVWTMRGHILRRLQTMRHGTGTTGIIWQACISKMEMWRMPECI